MAASPNPWPGDRRSPPLTRTSLTPRENARVTHRCCYRSDLGRERLPAAARRGSAGCADGVQVGEELDDPLGGLGRTAPGQMMAGAVHEFDAGVGQGGRELVGGGDRDEGG